MEFFKRVTRIDFMGKRRVAVGLSAAFMIVAVLSMAVQGMRFGIDFTGGHLIEIAYPQAVDLERVRGDLAGAGLGDAEVQNIGSAREVMVRLKPREGVNSAELSTQVVRALEQSYGQRLDLRRVEFVGPKIGDELAEQGLLAMLLAMIGILIYVWLRFEWRFAVGAIVATLHDVLFTLGWFSVLRIEFDLVVLAAVLAVIGYSLNDTIVVFDRIRENFRKLRKEDAEQVMNVSINETLARTIMTGLTTMLVVVALFYLGGDVVHGFSIALLVGIVIGTFSSIYVASPVTLWMGVTRADLLPVAKEGVEDNRP